MAYNSTGIKNVPPLHHRERDAGHAVQTTGLPSVLNNPPEEEGNGGRHGHLAVGHFRKSNQEPLPHTVNDLSHLPIN